MALYEHELILSATRKAWRVSTTHGSENDTNKSLVKIWEKVWKRDKNKCYFCNFVSHKHQEIHNLNDDHNDNALSNLTTICALCHQTFHLDSVSTSSGGKIIWLPEISQQDLNHICRAIFVALEFQEENEIAKMAMSTHQSLESRVTVVAQHFHPDGSEPGFFGQALLNLPKEKYDQKRDFLKNFKLLHEPSRFPLQVRYWKKVTFHDLPIESWSKLLRVRDNE